MDIKPLHALGFSESILRQRKNTLSNAQGAAGVDRLLSDGDVLELGAG